MVRREPRSWLDTDVHPDYAEDDFLKADSVLRWTIPAIALWVVVAVAIALITAGIAFAVGYVGRLLGVI